MELTVAQFAAEEARLHQKLVKIGVMKGIPRIPNEKPSLKTKVKFISRCPKTTEPSKTEISKQEDANAEELSKSSKSRKPSTKAPIKKGIRQIGNDCVSKKASTKSRHLPVDLKDKSAEIKEPNEKSKMSQTIKQKKIRKQVDIQEQMGIKTTENLKSIHSKHGKTLKKSLSGCTQESVREIEDSVASTSHCDIVTLVSLTSPVNETKWNRRNVFKKVSSPTALYSGEAFINAVSSSLESDRQDIPTPALKPGLKDKSSKKDRKKPKSGPKTRKKLQTKVNKIDQDSEDTKERYPEKCDTNAYSRHKEGDFEREVFSDEGHQKSNFWESTRDLDFYRSFLDLLDAYEFQSEDNAINSCIEQNLNEHFFLKSGVPSSAMECWRIYQKLSNPKNYIPWETLQKGLMTPTEMRALRELLVTFAKKSV